MLNGLDFTCQHYPCLFDFYMFFECLLFLFDLLLLPLDNFLVHLLETMISFCGEK